MKANTPTVCTNDTKTNRDYPPDDCDHDWKCIGTYDREPPTYVMKCNVCDKKEYFSQKGLKALEDSKHPAMIAVKQLERRVAQLERQIQQLQDK